MSFVTAIPTAIKVAGLLNDGYRFIKAHPEEVRGAVNEASKVVDAARRLVGNARDLVGADEAMSRVRAAARGRDASSDACRAAAEKTVTRARQAVLEAATLRMPLRKLVDRLGSSDDAVVQKMMAALDAPGCFALATYRKLDLDRDLTDYKGIYVGGSPCVGEGIATAISRAGNPDVYADIKYGQNVQVYVFGCGEDELDVRSQALIEALGAAGSYNMPMA